jgi:hypothetical protein
MQTTCRTGTARTMGTGALRIPPPTNSAPPFSAAAPRKNPHATGRLYCRSTCSRLGSKMQNSQSGRTLRYTRSQASHSWRWSRGQSKYNILDNPRIKSHQKIRNTSGCCNRQRCHNHNHHNYHRHHNRQPRLICYVVRPKLLKQGKLVGVCQPRFF